MNYGKTKIVVCEDEKDLGRKSAAAVAEKMRHLLMRQRRDPPDLGCRVLRLGLGKE